MGIQKHLPVRTDAQDEKANCGGNEEDAEAIKLLCDYARWLAVYPIAVKHFLRPAKRKGWDMTVRFKKRRYEIGPLLAEEDARNVIMEYDDEDGKPTIDSTVGIRARDPPLVVLNRLHEYAYDIAHFTYTHDSDSLLPSPHGRAIFYQQITDQLNTLYGAYGTLERIKGTPLPFSTQFTSGPFSFCFFFFGTCHQLQSMDGYQYHSCFC